MASHCLATTGLWAPSFLELVGAVFLVTFVNGLGACLAYRYLGVWAREDCPPAGGAPPRRCETARPRPKPKTRGRRKTKYYEDALRMLENELGEWYVNYTLERELGRMLAHYSRFGTAGDRPKCRRSRSPTYEGEHGDAASGSYDDEYDDAASGSYDDAASRSYDDEYDDAASRSYDEEYDDAASRSYDDEYDGAASRSYESEHDDGRDGAHFGGRGGPKPVPPRGFFVDAPNIRDYCVTEKGA